jgi:hypothetical protein
MPHELAAPAAVAVTPLTGEVVDLATAEGADLADALHRVRVLEADLRAFKRAVADELLRRMDREASWTLRVPHFEVNGDGPNRTDYDGRELRAALLGLAAEGHITAEAAESGVRVETSYVPVKGRLAALRKLGGVVAERIAACERPSEAARLVRVKPRPDSPR